MHAIILQWGKTHCMVSFIFTCAVPACLVPKPITIPHCTWSLRIFIEKKNKFFVLDICFAFWFINGSVEDKANPFCALKFPIRTSIYQSRLGNGAVMYMSTEGSPWMCALGPEIYNLDPLGDCAFPWKRSTADKSFCELLLEAFTPTMALWGPLLCVELIT